MALPFAARSAGVVVDWPRQGQLDATFGEDLVGRVQEVEHLGHPHVRNRLGERPPSPPPGVTPMSSATPAITRNSASACPAMIAASWTSSRVRTSRCWFVSTSSKAKLSK